MSEARNTPEWDHSFDVVVVGSGAGGMTAAICAHNLGQSVVLLEKSDLYGGTTAISRSRSCPATCGW